jgi:methionyl aminopeptidase
MSISLKRPQALQRMRIAGRIVMETFQMLESAIKPGVSLAELDALAEKYIISQGATGLYKGYQGSSADHPPFPGVICASVNHEICHGIPDDRILHEGDIVGIDIGLKRGGYCGDACVTFAVGQISPQAQRLLDITRECLRRGIEAAQPGQHLNAIGQAIHNYADTQGVSVVRHWGGHGIGRNLHEAPSVSHTREPEPGPELIPGMVFTIEPMINLGVAEWILLDDGWTVETTDGQLSAQFEHTIAITENGPEILTRLSPST